MDKNKRKQAEDQCLQCGRSFYHRVDHPNKYCSRICSGLARRHNRKCPVCGEKIKHSRNRYCGSECAFKDRAARTIEMLTCDLCGKPFQKHRCHKTPHNFCSRECAGLWWGMHKQGKNHPRYLHIGSENIRLDAEGSKRMWVKIGNPNIWVQRARKVILDAGHKLVQSEIVHHKNRNTLDDSLTNLQILTRGQHINLHRREDCHKAALQWGVRNVVVIKSGSKP